MGGRDLVPLRALRSQVTTEGSQGRNSSRSLEARTSRAIKDAAYWLIITKAHLFWDPLMSISQETVPQANLMKTMSQLIFLLHNYFVAS